MEDWRYKLYCCGEKETDYIKSQITKDLNGWRHNELTQRVNWVSDARLKWHVFELVKKKRLELSGK
jgi:hypothetical protein